MSSTLILVGVLVLTFAVYHLLFRRKRNLPPGPFALPLLGNVLSMGKEPHLTFMKWAQKYGPIFRCQLGTSLTIILDDPATIREAFNNPMLSGRPDNKAFSITAGGKYGIIATDGNDWQEQRRFTLRHLRDFGFGRQSMDALILEEVNEIIEWMKSKEGQPISVNRVFGLSVLNSLWMIITGRRFKHDDPHLTKIMDDSMQIFNDLMENGIALFVPELAEMFPRLLGWNKMLKVVEPLLKFFEDAVKSHEDDPGDENNPRDFIDVYMNEIKKTTNPESSFYGETGRKSLLAVVADLHGAGSETTSTTLSWAILYLSSFPEIQKRFQHEIDEVIGKSRMPCLADKSSMPYTEAVMMEVLRLSSLAPIGIFHTALADTEFHGYTIPKGAMIMANHYSVHMNQKIWGDPDKFRPERFLSQDGKTVQRQHEAFMPFSVGKRVCLGELLARDVLFLFLTGIFQRFDVKLNPDDPKPNLEPEVAILLCPKPFKVVMTDRLVA